MRLVSHRQGPWSGRLCLRCLIARGEKQPNETISIVVPRFVATKSWHNALHMRTAGLLRSQLLSKSGVVITDVPYRLDVDVPL